MTIWMLIIIIFTIVQRVIELSIARSNEQWMKSRGGIEIGSQHYKWFIFLHASFFIAIFFEIAYLQFPVKQPSYYLLFLFLITQMGRVWCIRSLGRFWNTKIIILPGAALIKEGPYKYVKHPNYIIVAVELITIPLLFGAYITAIIFPVLHILLLIIRIPAENKALAKVT